MPGPKYPIDVSSYTASTASKDFDRRIGWKQGASNITKHQNGDVTWIDEKGNKKRLRAKNVPSVAFESVRDEALKRSLKKSYATE
jgi:hypothetical protein